MRTGLSYAKVSVARAESKGVGYRKAYVGDVCPGAGRHNLVWSMQISIAEALGSEAMFVSNLKTRIPRIAKYSCPEPPG
jgi:hypothetical protein